MQILQINQKLNQINKKILTLNDLKKVLGIEKDNSAYKRVSDLIDKNIIYRINKGIFGLTENPPNDFEIANFLYQPSYISLETALNFYGILTQSPFIKTSLTTKKSKIIQDKFKYYHLSPKYFWGHEQVKGFLIACPEKALLDQIYLASKKIVSIKNIDECDLSIIDKDKFIELSQQIPFRPFQILLNKILFKFKP